MRAWSRADPPPLVLVPVGRAERVALVPTSRRGGFDDAALARARAALAARSGATHDVHPRLLEILYRAVLHFRAPYVHVISGYRDSARPTSRHAQGRAIDFVLPGVSDRRLAAWLRPQGFVGVGIYPTSGFVHLDVRARSYFWRDASGPGQPNRERPMLLHLAARYDAAARLRGEEPVPDRGPDEEEEPTERDAEPDATIPLETSAGAGSER